MPEVIFNGPDGRLEGRYHHGPRRNPPLALILHPHPQHGGTMNNKVVFDLFHVFVRRGFSVLRFNFRGVGRSQESFDHGQGELRDAAAALDWMQQHNANSSNCWIAGFSFGAWIGMQLLMRRPEIHGFLSVALPANMYDFSFLAPCPSSGLIVHGGADALVPPESVAKLVQKLSQQRGIKIDLKVVPGADHFFSGHPAELGAVIERYLDAALRPEPETCRRKRADEPAALRLRPRPRRARLRPPGTDLEALDARAAEGACPPISASTAPPPACMSAAWCRSCCCAGCSGPGTSRSC